MATPVNFFESEPVRRRLPVVQPLPVDPHWKCQREGDCCTKPPEVVMTRQESETLRRAAPQGIVLHFREIDELFVALKAAPCPLYVFGECLVYSVRPYNCRRYVCLRPHPKAEPFEADGGNLMKRVQQSRVARRMAQRIQNKAMGWAIKMGWPFTKEA